MRTQHTALEKYSCYEFEIKSRDADTDNAQYDYIIHSEDECIESSEYFDTEQEARFACIGHINLLENGGE